MNTTKKTVEGKAKAACGKREPGWRFGVFLMFMDTTIEPAEFGQAPPHLAPKLLPSPGLPRPAFPIAKELDPFMMAAAQGSPARHKLMKSKSTGRADQSFPPQ